MLAKQMRTHPRQAHGDDPQVWGDILLPGVNLAVWQRKPPRAVSDFSLTLVSSAPSLSESLTMDISEDEAPDVSSLACAYSDVPGYPDFLEDVTWLVNAFSYLVGARRVGLRLRALDKGMCPRFHVDHVPVRLITTYIGVASEWLPEGAMVRSKLGDANAEPTDQTSIKRLSAGDVALFKGEKWVGNEGAAIIHRSPPPPPGTRRLLLTLDWLQ